MGRDIYWIDGLLPPLQRVGERYVHIPAGRTLFVHNTADSLRLVYFLGDAMLLELPDHSEVRLSPGDAVAIGQPLVLRYRAALPRREASNHILGIRFSGPEVLEGVWARARGGLPARYTDLLTERCGGFRHFPGALSRPGASELLQLIRAEGAKVSEMSGWKVSGLCMALVADLLQLDREITVQSQASVTPGAAAAEHARQYLREHFRANLTLSKIAWEVRLSAPHLARQFRQHFGITVFGYLDRVRVEESKQLLLSTDLHLGLIAKRCGYSSSNLLCRHFKAITGQTPQTYRLAARSHEGFSPSTLEEADGKSQPAGR